jgi:hypothetical protein
MEVRIMKTVLALLMTAMFAGGILFSGSNSVFASTEGEPREEMLSEEDRDIDELERQIE